MTVLVWFLWRRWQFKSCVPRGHNSARETLNALHNNNIAGCRKHPVIYNDMCRIVRGMK